MRIEINAGGLGSALSVVEYQVEINAVASSIDGIISGFKAIRNSTLNLHGGTGNLYEAVENLDARIAKEEEKKSNAVEVKTKTVSFLDLAVRVDKQVAALVNINKDEFYRVNPWLKPVTSEERPWYQKAWDWLCGTGGKIASGMEKAANWIKDTAAKAWNGLVDFYEKHKKAILTALLLIAAVAVLLLVPPAGGLLATMLIGAAWGAIAGAVIGGVSGGMQSVANGGSFWEGCENGAFSGALSGAAAGAAFAGIGFAGQALGHSISAFSTLGKAIKVASTVTTVLSLGMGAFDTLALADLIIDPSHNPVFDLNSQAHSSSGYNGAQIGIGVLATFTGGMASTLNTQVGSSTNLIPFDENVNLAQDPLNSDRYFVQGNHGDEFTEFWQNGGNGQYTFTDIETPQIQTVSARDIEGVYLSNSEVQNPSGFWNKRYSREGYIDYVSNGSIGSNPIEVTKVNDFYYFSGDGRHRVIAAQIQNIDIPVIVKGFWTKLP